MKLRILAALAALASASSPAAVTVTVQADSGRIPISPWIYGRNSSLEATDIAKDNEAGMRLVRANNGNNATKYNWRNGLSGHPDWYNNVYANDWDSTARRIQDKMPGVQGMYAFQLLGWVAANTDHNFDDWAYNQSDWWSGTTQNLAGGGTPNASGGGKALVEGDASTYLTRWPADSTAGILDHWFGRGGLGLDSTRFRYWNMDNEPDGWSGTHDDVVPALTGHKVTSEEFVQKWVAVAKAVRQKFPGVRLVGPASMTEWQWYTWEGELPVKYKGKNYCFPEFLIKRLAEIQDSTKIRMLDVYDIHFYQNVPDTAKRAQLLQTHRLLYDTTYVYPWPNGIKTVNGGWDESINREYVFLRLRRWIDKHFGPNNGIGIGSTESAIPAAVSDDPSATAVWHSSVLGTMADNGTELYTPWSWYKGMYEAHHLFGRYARATRVRSLSSLDSLVSAYSSINGAGDSMTVILVNRDAAASQSVSLSLSGFSANATAKTLQLSGLSGETFVSHTQNALRAGSATVSANSLQIALPALSVTAVLLGGKGQPTTAIADRPTTMAAAKLTRNGQLLALEGASVGTLELRAVDGRIARAATIHDGTATLDLSGLPRGVYLARWPEGASRVVLAR